MDYLLEKNQLEENIIEMKKDIKIYLYKIATLKSKIEDHNRNAKNNK
jgi:hypothetical protein